MDKHDEILDSVNLETNYDIEEQKIISVSKFIFLCIVSFGIYEIWWIYKAWRFFQQKEKSDINPVARAIFSIIFLHSLFETILDFAREKDYDESYSSTALFVGFIVGNIMSRLPDPYWLISLLSLLVLIPPFKALNYAKQNSTDFIVTEQTSFNGRQIALIIFGVIFWALVIIGLNMGDV